MFKKVSALTPVI